MAADDELDGLDHAVRHIVGEAPGSARLDTLRQLLRDEYYLDGLQPLAEAVDALQSDALDLERLTQRVTSAIRQRHPAIAHWLVESFPEGLPEVSAGEVDLFLHRIVLLEVVMELVATRPGFLEELHGAIANQRDVSGLRPSGLGFARDVQRLTGGGVFEGFKLLLLDVAIDGYLTLRAEGETDRSGPLLRKNVSLDLNVLEAALSDLLKGYWTNGWIGLRLLVGRVQRLHVSGPERFVRQWLPESWPRRYHSWNLAFFVGNIDNLDLLLPKLFVPSVVDAKPEDYLYVRAVSVWFLANVVVHVLAQDPDRAQPMPNDRALSTRLGKLNTQMWA